MALGQVTNDQRRKQFPKSRTAAQSNPFNSSCWTAGSRWTAHVATAAQHDELNA